MGIPEWLRGMLKEGQFRSVYEMAHRIEAPQPTVHRWLNGQARPSAPYCIKLAEATGTPVERVLAMAYGDGEEEDEEMPQASEEQTASPAM